jgi:hypothetical protein
MKTESNLFIQKQTTEKSLKINHGLRGVKLEIKPQDLPTH